MSEFSELKGKTLVSIDGGEGDDFMIFDCDDGSKYQIKYYQDCCAYCCIYDICGDLQDLIGHPILVAEEVYSHDHLDGTKTDDDDSFTWTFYKLDTVKGGVTIRWHGSSNGYYSETATFEQLVKPSRTLRPPEMARDITPQDQVLSAHEFLKQFLSKFDHAQRGGVHDFMELTLFNMVNSSIKNIDDYLQTGHKQVDATEIMHIVVDSYQKVLDGVKRNLEAMNTVNFR
jgi:hypothetical protein